MKKVLIITFIALSIIAMSSCSGPPEHNGDGDGTMALPAGEANDGDEDDDEDIMSHYVSIIQLIANPTEYHGKKIAVHGVGNLGFEGTAVYLCEDNWYYVATQNAIWLSIGTEIADDGHWWYHIGDRRISYEDAQEYNGKYVYIEGTFDMYGTGHRGACSGRIYDITRLDDYSDIFHHEMEISYDD